MSKVTKKRLHSEERKSTENHERGSRTAEKHGDTERQKRKTKQFQTPSWFPTGKRGSQGCNHRQS
jgi:replication initiation and membrane attachment protein DnaB